MNTDRVKRVYEHNPDVRLVIDLAEQRNLGKKEINLSTVASLLCKQTKVTYSIAYGVVKRAFREFERVSAGKYIEGRRGHGSRFIFNESLQELIQMIKGKGMIQEATQSLEQESAPAEPTSFVPIHSQLHDNAGIVSNVDLEVRSNIVYWLATFELSPGRTVTVKAPKDATKSELAEVCKLLTT